MVTVAAAERTQVTIDSLKHELLEAQQMRAKDLEMHRREEARLQERHNALTRFMEVRGTALTITSQSQHQTRI